MGGWKRPKKKKKKEGTDNCCITSKYFLIVGLATRNKPTLTTSRFPFDDTTRHNTVNGSYTVKFSFVRRDYALKPDKRDKREGGDEKKECDKYPWKFVDGVSVVNCVIIGSRIMVGTRYKKFGWMEGYAPLKMRRKFA